MSLCVVGDPWTLVGEGYTEARLQFAGIDAMQMNGGNMSKCTNSGPRFRIEANILLFPWNCWGGRKKGLPLIGCFGTLPWVC